MHLHISLPPALQSELQQKLASGLYGSAGEVVQDALYAFLTPQEVEAARAADMQQRLAELARGEADAEDMDSFFDEIFVWLDGLPDPV